MQKLNRRDFIKLSTASVGAAGIASVPFVNASQMEE